MKKAILVFGFIIGVISLMTIRLFEKELFYDPLLEFYEGDFQDKTFPDLGFWKYSINLAFRYLLNTLVSLFLVWIAFNNKMYIKFSILLFLILFLTGMLLFWIVENEITSEHYMRLFYIRRFIIQPIPVILLLPAFYFQNLNKRERNKTY